MASHPRASAKNAEGNVPKLLKPSAEVAAKMAPVLRASFHDLLARAAKTPAQQRASKKR